MPLLNDLISRIKRKLDDYEKYGFSDVENSALTTFFDLAQEFDDLGDFYRVCVSIPRGIFGLGARMYAVNPKDGRLMLVASTEDGQPGPAAPPQTAERPYRSDNGSLVATVRGNASLIDQLPFSARENVLGIIEVFPAEGLEDHHVLFFEKYANRIGYNLHNRFIVQKNVEHLKFIRTLVADIEHNVITPNMVYKLYLRNLKGKIVKNQQLAAFLADYLAVESEPRRDDLRRFLDEISGVNEGLSLELENLERHYANMSLFLETLLRRGHFDHGRLMLRTKKCNIKRDVLEPQIGHYRERFLRMGITIDDRMSGVPDEDVINVVDHGLIAQVYSNLFSNSLKYAQQIVTESGEAKKYISYGREILKDHFGPGKDGVKYNVFSTGPHINPAETYAIFEEGFRGADTMDRPGTGHGLAFVKTVLEMHGGEAGYEATRYGNNFFFILPI